MSGRQVAGKKQWMEENAMGTGSSQENLVLLGRCDCYNHNTSWTVTESRTSPPPGRFTGMH